MTEASQFAWWGSLRAWVLDAASFRSWSIDANDGVIGTAGLLLGFTGAGASNRVLLFTAAAATIAGGLSAAGASWAEQSAERDAQLLAARREQAELATDPDGELEDLVAHWIARGLRPDTAREVALQLTERDALSAQLEAEHDFEAPMPASAPLSFAVGTGLAYMLGAIVPLLIVYFAPVDIEPIAIFVAVLLALVGSSVVASRAGEMLPRRMLGRTLVVGGLTMAVSYAAGELLL